ncbi:GNAT family N-acetyltransferase [Hasllibacter sp. MH4015]|uniref:GNAT family N-acetyltransferase n=1 Tax=Hasllibacter sp. MH4015 TaxID=2854029 RepID=UPI001CD771D6|nr:GNAT family N-acetyltransferase [Hasllibacter sp. MH4015]
MTSTVVHETERLTLQTWELDDFAAFAPIARDPAVMHFIADGKAWPDSRIGWFMGLQRAHQHSLGYCCWKLIERETGDLIGFCGIAPVFNLDETEIGWWLKQSHWGQGYASEAAHCVADAAFAVHGLDRLVARVYEDNAASRRLIGKLGMTFDRVIDRTDLGTVLMFETHRTPSGR